jgi:hypothetical protein
LVVKAHEEVITYLYDEEGARLDEIEHFLRKRVFLRATAALHHEQYEVSAGMVTQTLSSSSRRSCKRKSDGLKSGSCSAR